MLKVHQQVEDIRGDPGVSWEESCMRVPVVLTAAVEHSNFLGDDFFGDEYDDTIEEKEEEPDPSIQWYHKGYCEVVESMPSACLERSLLELWGEVRCQKSPPILLRRGNILKKQSAG